MKQTDKDGKVTVTQRADFSKAQVQMVAKFEKSYTAAVNKLASNPSAKATVSIGSNSTTVSAGFVAKELAARNMVADPGKDRGANTNPMTNTTTVQGRVLSGIGALQGVKTSGAESLRQIAIVHEGMHPTYDNIGSGMKFEDFNEAHQSTFNQAVRITPKAATDFT